MKQLRQQGSPEADARGFPLWFPSSRWWVCPTHISCLYNRMSSCKEGEAELQRTAGCIFLLRPHPPTGSPEAGPQSQPHCCQDNSGHSEGWHWKPTPRLGGSKLLTSLSLSLPSPHQQRLRSLWALFSQLKVSKGTGMPAWAETFRKRQEIESQASLAWEVRLSW